MKTEGATNVVFLSPPRPQRSRRKKQQRGQGVLWFREHRAEVAPFFAMWATALGATATYWVPLAGLWYFLAAGAVSGALYKWGDKVRAVRQFTAVGGGRNRSRRQQIRLWYLLVLPGVAATWSAWATWGAVSPGAWEYLVLALVTCLASTYWWATLKRKKSVRVEMIGISREHQSRAVRDARAMILDWSGYTSAAGLQGAELRGLVFNRWSVCIRMKIRRGMTTRNFTQLRKERLATASRWPTSEERVRVDRNIDGDSRMISVRYMLADPHKDTIKPPAFEEMSDEEVCIGIFEDASFVYFEWVNTLIAGLTRSGKSVLVNVLLRAFARMPHVTVIGIDAKPGAPELGPWKDVLAVLASSPGEVRDVLEKIMDGLTRRGLIMQQRGWRVWKPTPAEPFIVLLVDEVQLLDNKCKELLGDIASVILAMGGKVIVATQYPVKDNLPNRIKQNLDQRISFRVADGTADRVVFGDDAKAKGWEPSVLCVKERKGSFLIRNSMHTAPMLARGFFQEDSEVFADVEILKGFRTDIDAATWHMGEVTESAAGELEEGTVITAVQVADSPEDRVLDAISMGAVFPGQITKFTGIPKRTVNEILARLKEDGKVIQDGERKPYRRA